MAKYFKPDTDKKLFFCPCCGHSIIDHMLLTRLDALRTLYGKPIYVNSGFRCTEHNKTVGGNPNSEHLEGKGADIKCETSGDRYWLLKYAYQVGFRRIGLSFDSKFIHLGVCRDRPKDVFWGY